MYSYLEGFNFKVHGVHFRVFNRVHLPPDYVWAVCKLINEILFLCQGWIINWAKQAEALWPQNAGPPKAPGLLWLF